MSPERMLLSYVLQEADSECPSLLLGGYTYSWINLSWALEDVGSQSMNYYLPWADIPSRPRSAWPRLWEKPWEGCSRCHGEGHILKPSRQGMQQPAVGWLAPTPYFQAYFIEQVPKELLFQEKRSEFSSLWHYKSEWQSKEYKKWQWGSGQKFQFCLLVPCF